MWRSCPSVVGLLVGGCALYQATYGYTRWRRFRSVSWTRLTAAAVCLLLLPIGGRLPGLVTLLGLTVLVIALNVVEALIIRRTRIRRVQQEVTPAGQLEPAPAVAGHLDMSND